MKESDAGFLRREGLALDCAGCSRLLLYYKEGITGAGEPSSRSKLQRYFFLAAFFVVFLAGAFFAAAFFVGASSAASGVDTALG